MKKNLQNMKTVLLFSNLMFLRKKTNNFFAAIFTLVAFSLVFGLIGRNNS